MMGIRTTKILLNSGCFAGLVELVVYFLDIAGGPET
jgi:hypothetical protein